MRVALIGLAAVALAACTTMPNEQSMSVRIIDSAEAQGCTYISTLSAFDTFSPTFEKERQSVLVKLKTEAARINGNAILLTGMETNLSGSNGMAQAFTCPPTPVKSSPKQIVLTKQEKTMLRSDAIDGNPNSQYLYGAYLLGSDIEANIDEGLKWVINAAEQNHAEAQGYLGLIYYNGRFVEKNLFKAFDWRFKSASNGEVWSQGSIGFAYFNGEGVPENVIQAYVWMSMSSTQGNKEIKPWLKKLKSGMSPEQIVIAQKLATKCWDSSFKDCK